jgi:hypothetical protein
MHFIPVQEKHAIVRVKGRKTKVQKHYNKHTNSHKIEVNYELYDKTDDIALPDNSARALHKLELFEV